MKKTYFLLLVVGILFLGGCAPSSKTTQAEDSMGMYQKQFSEEQIEADALALAEIRCSSEVAVYNASLQQGKRKLQLEAEKQSKLKAAFEEKMKIRYLQIEELSKKFNKELEKAQKQLSACKALDDIHTMQAEMEKTKGENQ